MYNDPRLLVVDDEAAISYACRRVFSRQGFEVDECNDPHEALDLLKKKEYVAVLLDIKMPTMDGIEFLGELRKTRTDLPVIMMTGFPTISNAASAVRLGASDYVTKPFTPEEITRAVQQSLARRGKTQADGAGQAGADTWSPATDEIRFWDESWYRPGRDGSVRVGAMVTRPATGGASRVALPRIGEVVFQGLPLAGLSTDGRVDAIPSPISGVVVAVNAVLSDDAGPLWSDPCGEGWIACLAPTRLEDDARACARRNVAFFTNSEPVADARSATLGRLGCRVRTVRDLGELWPVLQDPAIPAVIVDGPSLGARGPDVVGRIHTVKPSVKVVVLGGSGDSLEVRYREQGIFYYAVEPLDDGELGEIVRSVYGRVSAPQAAARPKSTEPVHAIGTVSLEGRTVQMLADRGLVVRDHGLGGHIRRELLARGRPLETVLGDGDISTVRIAQTAGRCDRLLVITARDTGRLPGCLLKDSKREWVQIEGESAEKVTTLIVQSHAAGLADLDERTVAALARHVVDELIDR